MRQPIGHRSLAAVLVAALMLLPAPDLGATADKTLSRISGTVGHTPDLNGPVSEIAATASLALPDNEFAITRDRSQGLLTLPDSSQVTLGSNTTIQVGAFNDSSVDGSGSTVTLKSGTVRFKIVRPPGGKSNYKFVTNTSTTGVRGTVAAISSDPQQGDTIACIDCAAGDVVVTLKDNSKSFSLVTGQVIRISIAGIVIGATIAAVASQFAGAGVSMSATSATGAAGAGAGGAGAGGAGAGAGSAAAGASTAGIAAGVAAAAAAAVVISNNNKATPQPSPTGSLTLNASKKSPRGGSK